MSHQLLSIQSALQELGINGYYLPSNTSRHLAQLTLEIQTGAHESNHLEICEIPIPDSELFLLQWYVQLPLPEPFGPDDIVPVFLQDDTRQLCAALNQILPIGTFNLFEGKLCFRHIFVSEIVTPRQTEYLVQTIESEIERCQPLLQDVAIGLYDATEGIANIDLVLQGSEVESEEVHDTNISYDVSTDSQPTDSQPTDSLSPIEENTEKEWTDEETNTEFTKDFSIDSLANASLNIEDTWDVEGSMIIFEDSEDDFK